MATISKTFGFTTITKTDEASTKTVMIITADVVVQMIKNLTTDTWTCLYLRKADQAIMAEFSGTDVKNFEFLVIRWENDAFVGVVNSDMINDDSGLQRVKPDACISLQDGVLLLQEQTRVILDMSKMAEVATVTSVATSDQKGTHALPVGGHCHFDQDAALVAAKIVNDGIDAGDINEDIAERVVEEMTDRIRASILIELEKVRPTPVDIQSKGRTGLFGMGDCFTKLMGLVK
jgi:hypothetical protein